MTDPTPTPTSTDGPSGPGWTRRRIALVSGAVVVVAAVVALVVVLTTRGGTSSAASSTSTSAGPGASTTTATATPSGSVVPNPPTPTPSGPTANATDLPADLAPVPLAATASVGNGVVASLPSIRGIQAKATGPGNVAGPAVQVTVRIQNGTAAPIGLGGVAVNVYYGVDRTPAATVDDPSAKTFAGTLAAGASADGTYVFSVPADARQDVTVEVGYQAGAPLLQFTGAVH
jgi:hypothetical protein